MKKYLISLIITLSSLTATPLLQAGEVAEGLIGGGLLGAAIGGAAGGGRGAGIGAAVGGVLGATAGAARRSERRRDYYDYQYSNAIYEQNDELVYENENLIQQHKFLVQKEGRYNWMLHQCQKGKINYRNNASKRFFEGETNYNQYLRWQRERNVRKQNRKLARINNNLRSRIRQLQQSIRQLKYELENCEKYSN